MLARALHHLQQIDQPTDYRTTLFERGRSISKSYMMRYDLVADTTAVFMHMQAHNLLVILVYAAIEKQLAEGKNLGAGSVREKTLIGQPTNEPNHNVE